MNVQILPTGDPIDAPVWVGRKADGTYTFARERIPPDGFAHWAFYPHAVVVVDGVVSPFDLKRRTYRVE